MKTRIILTGIVVCGLAVGLAAAQAPLAERIPSGALVYVGWAGQTLPFSGSMFGQLINDPAVGQILGAIRKGVLADIDDPKGQQAFRDAWGMAKVAWKHPIALAVLDVKKGEKGPEPSAVLLIDLGRDRDAFAKHLDAVLAATGEKLPFTDAAIAGVNYKTCATPIGVPVAVGYMGNIFFLAAGADLPKRLIELGEPQSLQADKEFAAAMKAVSGENVQGAFYVDVARVKAVVESFTGGPAPPGAKAASPVQKISAALGVDKVHAVAGAVRVIDRGLYTKAKVFTPAPHRGLLLALAGKPLSDADLATLPADSLYACAINLSPKDAYDELRRVVGAISPQADQQLARGLAQVDKMLGLSIVEDVLANLGDTWTFATAPSLGGLLTGTILSVEVKDEAKFKAAADKITAFFRNMLSPPASAPAEATSRPRRGSRPRIDTVRVDRTDVHYVAFALRRTPVPVAPAWAIHKKRLYIAGWPQVIQAAIAANGAAPLTKNPAYQKARARITGKPVALSYCNTPAIVRHAYPLILLAGTALANAAASELGVSAQPGWLPSLPVMEKYLWPQISAASAEADGVVFESYGSMPGVGLAAAPVASPLTVAALMPALGRARHKARRARSMANLSGMGKAIAIYMNDGVNDRPPPNLAAVVAGKFFPPQVLVSPHRDHRRKVPRLVNGKLVGDVDYVYLYYPKLDELQGWKKRQILAYERPEYYRGEGTVVLYTDFSVQWVDGDRFREQLRRSKQVQDKMVEAKKDTGEF